MEWFESVVGPAYAPALMWTGVALLGLIVLLLLVKLLRSFGSGTFVSGGRNRKPRLAIMDATAVDNQRRLVLVRRDDVEHLILIGGSNDVVVERDIRLMQPASPRLLGPDLDEPAAPAPQRQQPSAARPALVRTEPGAPRRPDAGAAPQSPQSPQRPEPVVPARASPPVAAPRTPDRSPPPTHTQAPATPSSAVAPPPPIEAPAATGNAAVQGFPSVAGERAAPVEEAARPPARPAEPPAPQLDVDDDLLQELQFTLEQEERQAQRPEPGAGEARVDDEMDRLLGELSGQRR